MAINVKMKFDFKDLMRFKKKLIKDFVDDALVKEVQKEVVDGTIKKFMNRGISPVKGFGRFGEYVNPANYPGKKGKRLKPSRPVNLNLTGEMQDQMESRKVSSTEISVGIHDDASEFVKTKAVANNLGTERNGVGAIPRRRFIPQMGEQWSTSVVRAVTNAFTNRLKKLLSK